MAKPNDIVALKELTLNVGGSNGPNPLARAIQPCLHTMVFRVSIHSISTTVLILDRSCGVTLASGSRPLQSLTLEHLIIQKKKRNHRGYIRASLGTLEWEFVHFW